ncbi:DUF5722 domain-containing protein [Konateibacter massiliensis]|uniref:DUF5722 domain-containing protein n=1 Tax=Konateibacter massiliensis TaxID=2002841 RepID=UPI000C159948|nr:DUF5722 domain-containing protein [Konateibacter massiliensis]
MNNLFHKPLFKKLITLLLLLCLIGEAVMVPNLSSVHAASLSEASDISENTNSFDTLEPSADDSDLSSVPGTGLNEDSPSLTEENSSSITTEEDNASLSDKTDASISDTDEIPAISDANDSSIKETEDQALEIDEETFPDAIFRTYVTEHFDIDDNNRLSANEIAQVESLDVSYLGIKDLTGLEYFTGILYLYCAGNKLETLSVDTLTSLTVLDCSYNYLTTLDLSKCTALLSFECKNNALAISVDEDNSFDLSALKDFNLDLTSDWSENTAIEGSTLTVSDTDSPVLITYRYAVSAPLLEDAYVDFTLVSSAEISDGIEINATNFPDSSFLEYVRESFDSDGDSVLTPEEVNSITYLYMPQKNISDLSGITYFQNLVYLNFEDNAVHTADLNSLVLLRGIYSNNNELEQLSCEQLTNLTELYCSNNKLYSLNLSGCISLAVLECSDNVYEVEASGNALDLSALPLLDLSKTSDWSNGTLTLENTLTLEENTEETSITYSYLNEAPNEALQAVTFTLEITPSSDEAEVTQDTQTQGNTAPEVVPAQTSANIPVTYTISFNSDGGSSVSSQTVSSGIAATSPKAPSKSGYLFDNWYYGNTPYNFNTPVSSDLTLTARWTKVAPAKPTIKSLKNSSKSKMKITLKSVKNIAGYEVSYSTNKNAKTKAIVVETAKTSFTAGSLVKGKTYYVRVRSYAFDSTGNKVYSNYSKIKKLTIKKGLSEAKATSTSATIKSVKISGTSNVKISAKTKDIIKSKDNYYYLFSLPSYTKKVAKNATPLGKVVKSTSFNFTTPLNLNASNSLLHSKFVIAVKVSSGYQIISKGKYITNPQNVANFTYSFPKASTKKGLQINADMLNDVKDLGVKNSAFNIPIDMIIAAPGENNYRSGIDYEYNGKTYWFRKGMVAAYDSLFRQLENQDIVVTAIVLLGWRDDLTYLITPSGREKGHNYYAFNTSSKAAREQLEATFAFLGERYATDDGNGKVVNWIIGNEVNSFDAWNYAGTSNLSKYTQIYVDSYRLAYTAIKSKYSNARLYVSLDQCWNISNSSTFSAKEFLAKFDSLLSESGDISWNLAYHAYPSPLTDPRFWRNANGLSNNNENSPVISIYNISVLSKYIKKHYGKNTRIILSEQGFTSASPYGEKTQAAAMAYAYYLAEFDSMIDAFILSRHVDNVVETRDGLNLGLWTNRPGWVEEAYTKKYAWSVYKYMDTPSSASVTKFALKIIGKSSWKKIIPNYKASKFKSMPSAN